MGRIEESSDAAELLTPGGTVQLVHQVLSPCKIADPGEAVVTTPVGQVFLIHLPGQPFAAVHPHLNRKGKPGLNATAHESEIGIVPVMVQVHALALKQLQIQCLVLAILTKLVGHAGLDRAKNTDQSLLDAVAGGDIQSDLLFIGSAGMQVHIGSTGLFGLGHRGLDQLRRLVQGVLLEILHENAPIRQVGTHPRQVGHQTKGPAKNDAVPATQNPYNVLGVLLDERVHGILPEENRLSGTTTNIPGMDAFFVHILQAFPLAAR